jgi:alkaline phosphatase D
MKRFLLLLLAMCGAAVAPSTAAAATGFNLGVAAGDVTQDSAVLWARANSRGLVGVEVATTTGRFKGCSVRRGETPSTTVGKADYVRRFTGATSQNDRTVQVEVNGLRAGTRYVYRWCRGRTGVSDVGRFETAPSLSSTRPVEFAFTGDADAQPAEGERGPFWNDFGVYRRMAIEANDFNVNFGDTIYSDTEVGATMENGHFVPGAPTALSVAAKWGRYRLNLGQRNLRLLRRSTGSYNHWDDHEFVNDFTIPEKGRALYERGVRAFRDYQPVTYTSRDGLYRTFRWGRNLELFFLDERSFRGAKASSAGTCDNPDTGQPDLAPTLPQNKRQLFSALVPSLARSVSQGCLDRIRDPHRTFLGRRQYSEFTRAVRSSHATFKIVMNETPIQQFYALPYDRWEGYEGERRRLLRFLRDHVKNVLFLTTDTHGNLVNTARVKTFAEEGGPEESGVFEQVTGPAATKTFKDEINEAAGTPSAGDAVVAAFFKPAPPNGVGMACASIDVFSYSEVRVTSDSVTLTPKDIHGQPVKEQSGAPCGPFTTEAE